jgi:hypothetical protein
MWRKQVEIVVRQPREELVAQGVNAGGLQIGILPGRSGPRSAGINVAFRVDASTAYRF